MIFLPVTTKEEVNNTKLLLESYEEMKMMIAGFSNIDLTDAQLSLYKQYVTQIQMIDLAVDCIGDDELKEIIQHRYLMGNRFTETLNKFAKNMDERTVNRRINKGIEAIARRLKFISSSQ